MNDRLALRCSGHIRQLVDLQPVHLASVREEQQRVMGARNKDAFDEVVITHRSAGNTGTTASLGSIVGQRSTLDVTLMGESHNDFLFSDQVCVVDLFCGFFDSAPAIVFKLFPEFVDILTNEFFDHVRIGQYRSVVLNLFAGFSQIILELLALEPRQAAKLHPKNRIALNSCESKLIHECTARIIFTFTRFNQLDHSIDIVGRSNQAFEDVGFAFSLGEKEA